MSRTYRCHLELFYSAHGKIWSLDEMCKMPRLSTSGWQLTYVVNRKDKDKKPYYKPTKDFKKIYRRLERAKSKDAMNKKKEILPRFRKSDIWNYT